MSNASQLKKINNSKNMELLSHTRRRRACLTKGYLFINVKIIKRLKTKEIYYILKLVNNLILEWINYYRI